MEDHAKEENGVSNQTIRIPIRATYRMIDGEAVKIDAEYADVPVNLIAKMIIRKLGLPTIKAKNP